VVPSNAAIIFYSYLVKGSGRILGQPTGIANFGAEKVENK
jgi:hypothetical protein